MTENLGTARTVTRARCLHVHISPSTEAGKLELGCGHICGVKSPEFYTDYRSAHPPASAAAAACAFANPLASAEIMAHRHAIRAALLVFALRAHARTPRRRHAPSAHTDILIARPRSHLRVVDAPATERRARARSRPSHFSLAGACLSHQVGCEFFGETPGMCTSYRWPHGEPTELCCTRIQPEAHPNGCCCVAAASLAAAARLPAAALC